MKIASKVVHHPRIQLPKKAKESAANFCNLRRRSQTNPEEENSYLVHEHFETSLTTQASSSKFFLLETEKVGGVSSLVSIFPPPQFLSFSAYSTCFAYVGMLQTLWPGRIMLVIVLKQLPSLSIPPLTYKGSFLPRMTLEPLLLSTCNGHTFPPQRDPLNGESWTSNTPPLLLFYLHPLHVVVCLYVAFK